MGNFRKPKDISDYDVGNLLRFYSDRTARQKEVIWAVARGKTNREVGLELSITSSSVSDHLTNIYAELAILDGLEELTINRSLLANLFSRFFERHPEMRDNGESDAVVN